MKLNKIKKYLFKLALSIYILNTLFPSGQFVNAAEHKVTNNHNIVQNNAVIEVVNYQTNPNIKLGYVNNSEDVLGNCILPKSTDNNLVQKAGGVNLNQPLSCFIFSSEVKYANNNIDLKVEDLANQQRNVNIIVKSNFIINEFFAKKTEPKSVPILPNLEFIGFFAAVVLVHKLKRNLYTGSHNLKYNLSIIRLQILRC
jgi:hypothetical protein